MIQSTALDLSDRRYRWLGCLVLLLSVGGFGGWAALAPLDSAALASGVLTVKNYRKAVQHLEGGIVAAIHVREGQSVRADEPLLTLDSTQLRAEARRLRGQYLGLLAQEARLHAERDGRDAVNYPAPLQDGATPRAADLKSSQSALFQARRSAHAGEREVLEQRVEQLRSQVDGLVAVHDSNEALLKSFSEEITGLQRLQEKGFTGKQRLTELQRERAALVGRSAEALAKISANKIRIGETELQIIQLERYRLTSIADELEQLQGQLFALEERLSAIDDRIARAVVRAPVTGVVLGLAVHSRGGVIKAGATLLEIVPEQQQLTIEARVSPVDIDRVRQGSSASIRFSAFRSAATRIVEGRVTSISADSLVDERGAAYYLAQVEVSPESLAALEGRRLLPGMPVEVLIRTGTRTLLQYLLQPASNALARSFIED